MDAAKTSFKAKLKAWREWAEGLGHDVVWHGLWPASPVPTWQSNDVENFA